MSQSGRPVPSKPVTLIWGVALGLIAMFLLLAGGRNALSGLQSIMVTCALPFTIILIGVMVSWAIDLRNAPAMIRHRYAVEACAGALTSTAMTLSSVLLQCLKKKGQARTSKAMILH
nr:BCCT family transporter [Glutamicibacter mysorens]